MDACVLETVVMLMKRYIGLERHALAMGTHAHTLIFSSLFYLYGLARISICARTANLIGDTEMPDLEPVLSQLPPDMRKAICGAIAAERAGHCHEDPSDFHQNVLESHYIWTIEEGPFTRLGLQAHRPPLN